MAPDDDEYASGDECTYSMYKNNPDWSDISPLPQNDGPFPVVQIAYTDAFQDVFDFFRAIVAKGELSDRALTLTEDAIHMNAANYTVWQYRRKIIKAINHDLNEELEFCRDMIEMNPKNYQVWHHRRVIVEWLGDPSKELRLTSIIFSHDAKNYHAWEHRQWVLKTFKLFDDELEYVEELLEEDLRNNSAWNQRYFVISKTCGFTEDVIKREAEFAQKYINKVINNESPWSYLKGILVHSSKRLSEHEDIVKWCMDLRKDNNSPYLLSFVIDILEDLADLDVASKQKYLEEAMEICESLAKKHDKIRQHYWTYSARKIASRR